METINGREEPLLRYVKTIEQTLPTGVKVKVQVYETFNRERTFPRGGVLRSPQYHNQYTPLWYRMKD